MKNNFFYSVRFTAFALLAVILSVGFIGGLATKAFAENGYFSALPELPVPPLMQENDDSAVRFDQPEGRIITLQASGKAEPQEIIDFYDTALPSLGWTRHNVNDDKGQEHKVYYTRDKEVLFFEIKGLSDGSARLNVLLRPL